MKQEIVTPCALIVVGAAVCELIWTNQFNESFDGE